MNQFIYLIRPARAGFVKSATPTEEAKVGEHFAYLQDLKKAGRLILAGRAQTDEPFGIVIFEAVTEAEARQVMEQDPAVAAGVFLAELHPYRVALMRGE